MEFAVYNMEKKKIGTVAWPESLKTKRLDTRVHQTVVQQLTNARQGNANVKTRHEVSGSTRKIYRQKGTGNARHGDIKAPLFVGGGQAFGPKTRNWHSKAPQKIRQGALLDLTAAKGDKLWLIDKWEVATAKTKEIAALFKKWGLNSGLLILDGRNENLERSVRNLPHFKTLLLESMNAVDLLRYEHLLMTKSAYEKFIGRYS